MIKLAIILYMNVLRLITVVFFSFSLIGLGQNVNQKDSVLVEKSLFEHTDLLAIKLKYSRKILKKETNDSTYIDSELAYKMSDGQWESFPLKIRGRGNFRRKSCYFTPLKLKIKKSNVKETIFKGQKQLKIVLPCLNETDKDDNVIKEYIIYKMYEVISPYYFSTRLLDIEYSEIKKKRTLVHSFKGLMIEDNSKVAKRLKANLGKRKYHPKTINNLASVRLAMFQFMIGNTDFSTTYQHNSKMIFINKKFIPLPYDFDMAGFVNASYAVVSQVGDKKLPIENVTQRYYMGYKRDYQLFKQVREEFLNNKKKILDVIEANKPFFENQRSYEIAKDYILDFFKILADESRFKKKTYDKAIKLN